MENIYVKLSPAEAIDRSLILLLKRDYSKDEKRKGEIDLELLDLSNRCNHIYAHEEIAPLVESLGEVNKKLWNIEDKLREYENKAIFDDAFIQLARSVYKYNDIRAELKKKINETLGAQSVDNKTYSTKVEVESD